MAESCTATLVPSVEKRGSALPRSEIHFTPGVHARAARGVWPRKTAHHWAAAAGVTERMAKYWLAGTDVSEAGKLALVRELC